MPLPLERWREVAGSHGYYHVSSRGRIRNVDGLIRKTSYNNKWYVTVTLYIDRKRVTRLVSRLVAIAFVPFVIGKPEVNHKDGNKNNNHSSNLEWMTRKEQLLHARKLGLLVSARGKWAGNTSLTEIQVREIRSLRGQQSNRITAKQFRISSPQVCRIQNRKSWAHLPQLLSEETE